MERKIEFIENDTELAYRCGDSAELAGFVGSDAGTLAIVIKDGRFINVPLSHIAEASHPECKEPKHTPIEHGQYRNQDPSWTESDEDNYLDTVHFLDTIKKISRDENDFQNAVTCIDWLESIRKERRKTDLPKWIKLPPFWKEDPQSEPEWLIRDGYCISAAELFERLPKENR